MTDADQRRLRDRAIVNALVIEINEHTQEMKSRRRDRAAEEFFHGAIALAELLGDQKLAMRIVQSAVTLGIKWHRVKDLVLEESAGRPL